MRPDIAEMIEMENKWKDDKKDGKKPLMPLRITSRRKSAPSALGEPAHLTDTLSWPKEDIEKLLSRMKQHIPPSDHLRHQSRALHLPWDLIVFNEYTSLECQHMWKLVLQRVRGFRILQEVLADAEEWVKQPWTDFYASKSKNRHPDRPKMPLSSFMLYYKDQIKVIREDFPKLPMVEVAKIASEKFANLKAKDKAKYIKRSKLAKEEYIRNMEIFLAEHPSEMGKQKHPKKITPFNLFMEDQLQKDSDFEDKPFKELFSFYRHQWEELSEEEKLPWLHWAEQKQQEILQKSHSNEIVPPAKSVLTKKEQEICDRANGKPSKPPSNVYTLFTKVMLRSGELSEYNSKDRMKEVSLRWQSIGSEDRLALEKQLKEEKKQYAIHLEDYLKRNPTFASSVEDKSNKSKKRKKTKQNEIIEDDIVEETQPDPVFKEATYSGNKKKEMKHKKGKTGEKNVGFYNMNGHINERNDQENNYKKTKNSKNKYTEEDIYPQPDSVSDTELSPKKKKKVKNNVIPLKDVATSQIIVPRKETPAKKKKKHVKHAEELIIEETDSFKPVDIAKKKNKRKREQEPAILEEEQSAKKKKKSENVLSEIDLLEIINSSATEKTVMDGEPKPPPILPIKFFAKAMKKQKIKYASDEDLHEAWNNLATTERKFFKKSLKVAKDTYLSNYKTFLDSLSPKTLKKYLKLREAAGKQQ